MEHQFDSYTVAGLKNLARERGLRRYSRLRRHELIKRLIDRDLELFDAQHFQSTRQPTTSVDDLLRSLENVRVEQPSISPELNALKKKIKSIYDKVDKIKVKVSKSALKEYALEHKIEGIPVATPQEFLELTQPSIIKLLKSKRGFKVKMNLQCIMKRGEGKDEEKVIANFSSKDYEINLEGTNETNLYYKMIDKILENFVNFLRNGSGWVFHSVKHLKLHTVVYEPLRASSYIPLPEWIANKKVCNNMKNDDEECFTWSILRYLNPKEKNKKELIVI